MKTVTLRDHFDGERIRLDEPFNLEPDTPLTITVWPKDGEAEEERDWQLLSASAFEARYGNQEPEYSLDLIREPNPDYEGG